MRLNHINYNCYNFSAVKDDIDAIGVKIYPHNINDVGLLSGHNLVCVPKN